MQEYQTFLEGARARPKQRENAISRTTRAKVFIEYMAAGESEIWNWLFLENTDRVNR